MAAGVKRVGWRRVMVVGMAVVLGGWIGAVPTDAQVVPITAPVVAPTTVAPGQDFTVSGVADCIQGTTLTVSVPGLQLSVTVTGSASWSVHFTVPSTATPGHYSVTVTGAECAFPDGGVFVGWNPPTVLLVKTVGTAPSVCATTTSISVVSGTTVYYCYTVTNHWVRAAGNSAGTSPTTSSDRWRFTPLCST